MVAARCGRMSYGRPVDILVVGAGPTGLTLALQAHALGAQVRIVDRRSTAVRPSRALIVHPRTLEGLRPLGVAEPLLALADVAPTADLHVGDRVFRVSLADLDLPETAFPHLTLVRQQDVEHVLLRELTDRGVKVEWSSEVVAVQAGSAGACALIQSPSGPRSLDCEFVAGCDGPESTLRRAADIVWRGGAYREQIVLADVELDADLARGVAHVIVSPRGVLLVFALGERATWRLLASRPAPREHVPFGQPGPPVCRDELQALLDDAGIDARISSLAWSARYALQHRVADRFRQDGLFLVGDAAHAYSPATGQGMNTGIQDALNLGWKLAFARAAKDRAALLDSYELERRPVARQVLALTHLAFWAEAGGGRLPTFLRGVLAPLGAPAIPVLLSHRWLTAELIRCVSQLHMSYHRGPMTGAGAGQWPPDAMVSAAGKSLRLHELLAHPGVHILLHRDAPWLDELTLGPYVNVHRLESTPGAGVAVVRPDGYIGFRTRTLEPGRLSSWLERIGAAAVA